MMPNLGFSLASIFLLCSIIYVALYIINKAIPKPVRDNLDQEQKPDAVNKARKDHGTVVWHVILRDSASCGFS